MKVDKYGQVILNEEDLCEVLYTNPNHTFVKVFTETLIKIPNFVHTGSFIPSINNDNTIEEFDYKLQKNYYIPEKYKNFDIKNHIKNLCNNNLELHRVELELKLFEKYDMINLLIYLKYLVDITKLHNIVLGVGRGSSVASFVLYLLGIHKINSLKYNLSINEFFKGENL